MTNQMTERITVRMPADLVNQVREKSERTKIPYSLLIRNFLQWWVTEEEDYLPLVVFQQGPGYRQSEPGAGAQERPDQMGHPHDGDVDGDVAGLRASELDEVERETLLEILEYIRSQKRERDRTSEN